MLSNTTSPPFGAAALWAAQIPQCLRQGKPKNWARRQFGCTQAATYAYNNAKMALCQHGSCEASLASSLRRVESAHEACERFSCSPEDLLHLRTSQPKPSNNFLGCTGTTRTGKDWGVCTAYLKEVRALVQRHRKALGTAFLPRWAARRDDPSRNRGTASWRHHFQCGRSGLRLVDAVRLTTAEMVLSITAVKGQTRVPAASSSEVSRRMDTRRPTRKNTLTTSISSWFGCARGV